MVTILYIDDNEKMTELFSLLGRDYDFNALTANSLSDGMNLLSVHVPDLIITDLYMPDGDAYKLTALLKSDSRTSSIPVIICTNTQTEKRKKSFLLGAKKLIHEKPYNIRNLNHILEGIFPPLQQKKALPS